MKKYIMVLAAILVGSTAFAQEEKPAHFKLYGFIRNYVITDTREVNAGTNDLFMYMPKDRNMQDGIDLNDGFNWRYLSLTTRLGLDVSAYKFGTMNLSGKVEADFYSLSGTTASAIIPQLRLRQAFVKLSWDDNPLTLTLGQAWHPMGADLPHITNLESGAPFNPFNRSPQLTLDCKAGDFTFTASMLYLNHFLPTGPDGKSTVYYKYGFPEAYLGVTFKKGAVVAKAGVDIVNSKPIGYVGYNKNSDGTYDETKLVRGYTMDKKVSKASGILTAVSPFVFFQYTKGLFQLRAKAILAQSGEHMNLLSGYGVASLDDVNYVYTYTPMQDLASFLSFQYGKKVQVMSTFAYFKQLGTTKDLVDPAKLLWINTAADTKIQQAFRVTPTVAWNIGKFTVSLEYDLTAAAFGRGSRNLRGMYDGTPEWIMNHRLICMTKFTF